MEPYNLAADNQRKRCFIHIALLFCLTIIALVWYTRIYQTSSVHQYTQDSSLTDNATSHALHYLEELKKHKTQQEQSMALFMKYMLWLNDLSKHAISFSRVHLNQTSTTTLLSGSSYEQLHAVLAPLASVVPNAQIKITSITHDPTTKKYTLMIEHESPLKN